MNKEEIVELAKLAGIYHAHDSEGQWNGLTNVQLLGEPSTFDAYAEKRIFEILEPLVKLVVERERNRYILESATEAKKTAASIETLYALYEQASQQRDQLMDAQRAQVAAMRGRIQ